VDRFEWERLIRELDLPGAVKATAYALATYVNARDGTRGHPGLPGLSRAAGFSATTVGAALAALEAGGLVTRAGHGGGRGRKRAASYSLDAGATGLTTEAETVGTVRRVFEAKTHRKTSYRPNSNGLNSSDSAQNSSDSAPKDFGPSEPITPRSPLYTSSLIETDRGALAEVEGNGARAAEPPAPDVSTRAGTERRRMELADALTAWQLEHEAQP
jgi:hypothetical protein